MSLRRLSDSEYKALYRRYDAAWKENERLVRERRAGKATLAEWKRAEKKMLVLERRLLAESRRRRGSRTRASGDRNRSRAREVVGHIVIKREKDEQGKPLYRLYAKSDGRWLGMGFRSKEAARRIARNYVEVGLGRDPSRHRRHRSPNAPTFRQEAKISRKIRLLRREGYGPKQAAAIAYRMAGVPARRRRRG